LANWDFRTQKPFSRNLVRWTSIVAGIALGQSL
jgi:hypothetical protein